MLIDIFLQNNKVGLIASKDALVRPVGLNMVEVGRADSDALYQHGNSLTHTNAHCAQRITTFGPGKLFGRR